MTKGGVIVKNRKMFLGTGIFLALGALLFMRSALAISFVSLNKTHAGFSGIHAGEECVKHFIYGIINT